MLRKYNTRKLDNKSESWYNTPYTEKREQNMKQNFTLYIYKTDKRTKSGERVVRTQVCTNQDDAGMQNLVDQLIALYPAQSRYRFEWFPTTVTVKNLMTGKDVEIDRDTPWCCNPASETYWSA